MNLDVGIITFHRSLNYGSALQAWALAKTISELGMNPEIIDYVPKRYRELYAMFWFPRNKKILKYDIVHAVYFFFFFRRKRDFSLFWKNEIPLSKEVYRYKDDISPFVKAKYAMICGSDQIWNPRAKDFDFVFLLPVKCKIKIAYAASIGNAQFNDSPNPEIYKDYLKQFHFLSMREASGAQKLMDLLNDGTHVEVVLDPTLLLPMHAFDAITEKRVITTPYIFFYSVWLNKESIKAATEIGERYKLPVYTLVAGPGSTEIIYNRKKLKLAPGNAGPCAFLGLLQNAEYIVTDSFHGTALSIVFEKKFVTINVRKQDGTQKNDERIRNILQLLNLDRRFISSNEINKVDLDETIDYEQVRKKRMEEAEKSINYLKIALADSLEV